MSTIDVHLGDEPPQCMRCLSDGLLTVKFPQTRPGSLGAHTGGSISHVLCPACDHDVPQATELLALFTVDDRITGANSLLFTELLLKWTEHLNTLTVDEDQLDREIEQWENGEL
ncbi:DUF6300 family protein [Kitasatospora sp. NPDC094016]|uniref:DUF6300 family protein n=1 Tax=Kitasatospora sp. NPDC094016 TaxID=3154986 RepID=UPI00332C5659